MACAESSLCKMKIKVSRILTIFNVYARMNLDLNNTKI